MKSKKMADILGTKNTLSEPNRAQHRRLQKKSKLRPVTSHEGPEGD